MVKANKYFPCFSILVVLLSVNHVEPLNIWATEGFDSPKSWENGRLPCYLDTIVFPRNFDAALTLSGKLDVSGIVLPRSGGFLLNDLETTLYGRGSQAPENSAMRPCDRKPIANFRQPKPKSWFDSINWRKFGGSRPLPATPHETMIPCSDSPVHIDDKGVLSIDLENSPHIGMGSLAMFGMAMDSERLQHLASTPFGQFIFKSTSPSVLSVGGARTCPCHSIFTESYMRRICQYEKPRCEIPKCANPIQPSGHCCPICGVIFKNPIGRCDQSLLKRIRLSVSEWIVAAKLKDKISSFSGYVQESEGDGLQTVFVDINEYDGVSVKFAESIRRDYERSLENATITMFSSGHAIALTGISGFLLMFLTFLGVASFFGGVYWHYTSERNVLYYIPTLRRFRSPFVFARFENQLGGTVNATDVVVGMPYEDPVAPIDPDIEDENTSGGKSFKNPMFREKEIEEVGTELKETTSGTELKEVAQEVEAVGENAEPLIFT